MFFVGSLINSLANQMTVLIAGRTVQGLGGKKSIRTLSLLVNLSPLFVGGCIMSMAFIIITDLSPPHLRPRFQSLLTVIYGLASCVGPLIGKTESTLFLLLLYLHIPYSFFRRCICRSCVMALGFLVECDSFGDLLHHCGLATGRTRQDGKVILHR